MATKKNKQIRDKQSGSWFEWTTNDLNLAEKMKMTIRDFREWGYIHHLPDDEEGKEHYHFLINTNGTRTIKQIADKVEIPSNFVRIVNSVVGYKRYFIHLDNPEKRQYSFDDIHTNNHRSYRDAIDGNTDFDLSDLFSDFSQLYTGKTNPKSFILKHYIEIEHLSFYQKIKIFQTITDISRRGVT